MAVDTCSPQQCHKTVQPRLTLCRHGAVSNSASLLVCCRCLRQHQFCRLVSSASASWKPPDLVLAERRGRGLGLGLWLATRMEVVLSLADTSILLHVLSVWAGRGQLSVPSLACASYIESGTSNVSSNQLQPLTLARVKNNWMCSRPLNVTCIPLILSGWGITQVNVLAMLAIHVVNGGWYRVEHNHLFDATDTREIRSRFPRNNVSHLRCCLALQPQCIPILSFTHSMLTTT